MEQHVDTGLVSFADFLKVDIRSGTVVRVEEFQKARKPAYKLWIDFGSLGVKGSSAQLTGLYRPEELKGRQVLAVVNFPKKQVADFVSEALVLGLPGAKGNVVLVYPERPVPNGARLF